MKIDIRIHHTKDLPKDDDIDDKKIIDFLKKSIKILKYREKKLYHEKQLEKINIQLEIIENQVEDILSI